MPNLATTSASFEPIGSIGGAWLATLLIVAVGHGLGSLVVPAYAWRGRETAALLRVAVGITLMGALGIGLGSSRLLSGQWIAALLGMGAFLAAVVGAVGFDKRLRSGSRNAAGRRAPAWLWFITAVAGLVTLGPALCYPTGWDELVYHHELPKRWLADGWPAFYADLPYSGFPSLGEILFWLMAPIENAIAPRLLVWACWVIALAFVFRLLRRRVALIPAAALTAAYGLSGAVLMISANCYVESILLMNVSGLLLVLETRERAKGMAWWRKAVIAGLLVGGSAAVKLTGLAVVALPCFWYAGELWSGRMRMRAAFMRLALCLFVAAVVASPIYLRPWLLTGNPFYPYYAEWFTADAASLEMSVYHHALGTAFGFHTPQALITGPLLLAFNEQLYDGAFGWQVLLLIFLAALAIPSISRLRMRRFVLWPLSIAGWLYLFWYSTAQQARFAIPAALGLVLLAAVGLRRLRGQPRRILLAILLAATIISLPWRNAGHYFGSWMTVLGMIHRVDYVNESTDRVYLPLVRAIAEHTPADAHVMLLFEHRLFYLPRPCEIGTPFFQAAGFTPPEQFDDPERLMRRLAERQITHLVMTNALAGPDQVPAWFERMEKFIPCIGQCVKEGKLEVVWQSERYLLLAVKN